MRVLKGEDFKASWSGNVGHEPVHLFLVADGHGGVIVAFTDDRNGSRDIYAQRFDRNGNEVWTTNGVPVCTDPAAQDEASLCSDGNGGYKIVQGVELNDFLREKIDASVKELQEEKAVVADMLP